MLYRLWVTFRQVRGRECVTGRLMYHKRGPPVLVWLTTADREMGVTTLDP